MQTKNNVISRLFNTISYDDLDFLRQFTTGVHARFIAGLVFTIILASTEVVGASVVKILFDNHSMPSLQISAVWMTAILIVFFVFRAIALYGSEYYLAWVCSTIKSNIRQNLFNKFIIPFNPNRLQSYQHDINTNILFGAENIGNAITTACTVVLRETIAIVTLFAYMLYLSPLLCSVFAVAMPLIALIIAVNNTKMRNNHSILQTVLSSVGAAVEEVCKGQIVLQVYKATRLSHGLLSSMNQKTQSLEYKLNNIRASTNAMTQMIIGLPAAAIFYIYLTPGWVSQGTFVAFIFCATRIMQPIKSIAKANAEIQKALASLDQLRQCINAIKHEPGIINHDIKVPEKIQIDNLTLYTTKSKRCVLRDINLCINQGEKIALLGVSGSGKSTLINAILGLAKHPAGSIRINDRPIEEIERGAYHTLFSYVGQEPLIFHGSIKENIALGYASIDESRLVEAAKAANAHEFIEELPEGYDTTISQKDKHLSGGQLQRINIARAIYKNAPIFLLDEMTSALDKENEQWIIKGLKNLLRNKIAIIITHRQELIELADRVWRVDNGYIKDGGSKTNFKA